MGPEFYDGVVTEDRVKTVSPPEIYSPPLDIPDDFSNAFGSAFD
jgi:hypothetical protein